MRSYLAGVLVLLVALMAFELSQARLSSNSLHIASIAPSLVNEPSIEEQPALPKRKMKASLLSRNVLRVNHKNNGHYFDKATAFETYGVVRPTEIAKWFVDQAMLSFRYESFRQSRYRVVGGKESNLIYRFMHAK